ncbi:MAG: PKD domain-containing protein, partial [Thermoplasmata archaeon]
DAADGYVLYFGGGLARDATQSSNWQTFSDTWSFHAGQWTNRTAQVGSPPPALMTAGMAYDPASNVTLLYGGAGPASGDGGCVVPVPQLWRFGNGTWKNLTPPNGTNGPGGAGGLEDLGLTYDPQIGGLLLFGGTTSGSAGCYSLAETWTYVNGTWTNLTGALATPVPGARQWFPLVYDMADGYAFLSGGNDYGTTTYYADSWALGNLTTTPPALEIAASDHAVPGSEEVTFSAVVPSGPVPTLLKWEFGDGSPAATGPTVTHEYPGPGLYLPLLLAYEGPSLKLIIRLPAIDFATAPAAMNPGPSTGPLSPSFLLGPLVGLAVGALIGAAVVVGWNARRRRLRTEGLALVSTARQPNELQ